MPTATLSSLLPLDAASATLPNSRKTSQTLLHLRTSTIPSLTIPPQELAAELRTMTNSSSCKDRLEYHHLRLLDPKESTSDPSNFRPIALMSRLYKLFMAVIAKRMTSFSINENLLSNAQKSARPSKGCYEHAFILESVLNNAHRQPGPLSLAWLGIRNAFGSIPHAVLSMTLLHMGFPPPLVQILPTPILAPPLKSSSSW